jgi:hypothetical protein
MNKLKKILSLFIVISIIYSAFPTNIRSVFADTAYIGVSADGYDSATGSLTVRWAASRDLRSRTSSIVVSYHTPIDNSGDGQLQSLTPITDSSVSSTQIDKIKSNYIYDITVQMFDASGSIVGQGMLYYLPRISFYSEIVEQDPDGTDRTSPEIGDKPVLKLSWPVPKVWDGSKFIFSHDALDVMKNTAGRPTSFNLDYRIGITAEASKADVVVKYSGTETVTDQNNVTTPKARYTANISSDASTSCDVNFDSTTGYMSLYLLGRKDINTVLPTISQIQSTPATLLPSSIQNKAVKDQKVFVLPHPDLLPGTVYDMVLLPFFNNAGTYVDIVQLAEPNGSPLLDNLTDQATYTYTPIRFQLSKVDENTAFVKIYKVNMGTHTFSGLRYEIQSGMTPLPRGTNMNVMKTLEEQFFFNGLDYAVTEISNINAKNLYDYKIVINLPTTDSTVTSIESSIIPYTLSEAVDRPIVPGRVTVVSETLGNTQVFDQIKDKQFRPTDITISWDKPANWEEIKSNDLYIHILISSHPFEPDKNAPSVIDPILADEQYGSFPVKYRWVKFISSRSANIVDNGNGQLLYTLKGSELFTGEDSSGNSYPIKRTSDEVSLYDNSKTYPSFLLPNSVYYFQLCTSKGITDFTTVNSLLDVPTIRDINDSTRFAQISDRSITSSFTTYPATEKDIPLPKNFRPYKEDGSSPGTSSSNGIIKLELDKIDDTSIDWGSYTSDTTGNNIYYDLYMSTQLNASPPTASPTASATLAATSTPLPSPTQTASSAPSPTPGASTAPLTFTRIGSTDTGNSSSNVTFVETADKKSVIFTIKGLYPNTTYYFKARTRLVVVTPSLEKESIDTAILPVTTGRDIITNPDDSARKPLAPTDFDIAKDTLGNLMLTGSSSAFNWSKMENDVTYTIICSSGRVLPNASPDTYLNDPTYISFTAAFGGEITLDPLKNPLDPGFEYDNTTKLFKYSIEKFLIPNKLYYFSIRAVSKLNGRASEWISIPVTTSLIDAPLSLEALNDAEIGFSWTDSTPNMRTDDYSIYMRGPKDSNFKILAKNKYTIVKDSTTYYGRLKNLDTFSSYDIRVYKGITTAQLVFEKLGIGTIDACHQAQVKWEGMPGYKYEVSIKAEGDTDYTTLTDTDMKLYIEKTSQNANTSYKYFYARIISTPALLEDGTLVHKPLSSNVKYYIKVRASSIDPKNPLLTTYSKYAGPVDIRTEFNQTDYNSTEQEQNKKVTFLDKLSKFEQNLYWKVDVKNGTSNKILVNGDKAVNAIENTIQTSFTLDVSQIKPGVNTDTIYMPLSVINLLNQSNKNLIIRTAGADFTLRPKTLDPYSSSDLKYLRTLSNVKDIYIKLTVTRTTTPIKSFPANTKLSSKINDFGLQAIGSSKTDSEIEALIHDRIYNADTGLVKEKLNIINNSDSNSGVSSPQDIETLVSGLLDNLESSLSDYIKGYLEGTPAVKSLLSNARYIKALNPPLSVKMNYQDGQGLEMPYAFYTDSTAWSKMESGTIYTQGALTFNPTRPGKYAVLSVQYSAAGMQASDEVISMISKYNLEDILGATGPVYSNKNITVKELILLYERIANKAVKTSGLTISQKCQKLGLNNILNPANVNKTVLRQELAGVIVNLFASETGANAATMKPKKRFTVKDESKIGSKYYKSVIQSLDLGLLTLDSKGYFLPNAAVTRANLLNSLLRLQKMTGNL